MFRNETYRRIYSRSRSPITNGRARPYSRSRSRSPINSRRGRMRSRSRSRSQSRSREKNPSWWMSEREISTFNYITHGATRYVNFEDTNVLKMFDGKTPANLIAYYNVCKKRRERQGAADQLLKQKNELANKVDTLENNVSNLQKENTSLKSQLSSVVNDLLQQRSKVRELLKTNEQLELQLQQSHTLKSPPKVDYSQQVYEPDLGEINFKNNDSEPNQDQPQSQLQLQNESDEIENASTFSSSDTEYSEYQTGVNEPENSDLTPKTHGKTQQEIVRINKRMMQFKRKMIALYNDHIPKSDPRVGWAFSGPQKYFDRAKAIQIVNELWGQ